jgi:hypothetical protein
MSELRILVGGGPPSCAQTTSATSGAKGSGAVHARSRRADAMPDRWVLPRHPVFKTGVGGSALGPAGRRRPRKPDRKLNSEMNAHIFELNGYVIPA